MEGKEGKGREKMWISFGSDLSFGLSIHNYLTIYAYFLSVYHYHELFFVFVRGKG